MNKEFIEGLTPDNLLDEETFAKILLITDQLERTKLSTSIKIKAKKFGISREFESLLKSYIQDNVQKNKRSNSNIIAFTESPISGLRCGKWKADDSGVIRQDMVSFEPVTVVASPHPILPTERLVNIDTETEKIKLAFYKDKRWQSVIVERSTCANKGHIVSLADRGIEVTTESARELVKYISDVVALNMVDIPVYKAIGRCGWIGKEFAPYAEGIKFDGDNDFKQVFESIKEKGSYEDWKKTCAQLRENIYIRLLMAASFASPLLEKIGALPFVVHLWGGTGTGKTVGLMVAMSIWGDPELGNLVKSLNMTQNAMARVSAFLNNIPFAGDELQIIKTRWDSFDSLIMFLTEGIDRGRAKSYGGVETQKTWKCSFLFTGEEPITKSSSGGGVKNRIIEIELTGQVIEDGNLVSNFVRQNYGFAGKEFVEVIKDEDFTGQYREIFTQILKETDTTEKQAMAMACMMLADKLSVKYIFPDEVPLTVFQVKPFLTSVKDVDIAARAYDWIINWVAKNKVRFGENGGEIWGKVDGDIVCINRDVLADHLKLAGFDYHAVISKFAERGQIVKNSANKTIHYTKVFGNKAGYIKLIAVQEEFTLLDETPPFEV